MKPGNTALHHSDLSQLALALVWIGENSLLKIVVIQSLDGLGNFKQTATGSNLSTILQRIFNTAH
jgi:hypothetical protein